MFTFLAKPNTKLNQCKVLRGDLLANYQENDNFEELSLASEEQWLF